jgi:hypothetical protein
LKVFFDNCTSPVMAEAIHGYLTHKQQAASHIRDLPCGRHATDVEWIAYLRESGDDWLVFTGDRRIQRNRAERLAYRHAQLKGFVFAPAYQNLPVSRQVSLLLWRWADIEGLLKLAAPFLFELPINRISGIRQLPL